jgi:hypothetical protein
MWWSLLTVLIVAWAVLGFLAWQRYRHAPRDPLTLKPPVERFGKLPPAEVEALRARAAARRQAASAAYRQSVQNTLDRS